MRGDAALRVRAAIEKIRLREKDHIRLLHAVFKADDGALFAADLIAAGAVQRSLMLSEGFVKMLRSGNYLCGGALVRMQLDTVLRLYAASLFPSGNETLRWFLEDRPLFRLRAPDGKYLTDKELCTRVAQRYEWVPRVYERTSGYVHFSSPALLSVITQPPKNRRLSIAVGPRTGLRWKTEERLEAAEAFDAATQAILEMVYSWGYTKALAAARRSRAKGNATSARTHE